MSCSTTKAIKALDIGYICSGFPCTHYVSAVYEDGSSAVIRLGAIELVTDQYWPMLCTEAKLHFLSTRLGRHP